MNITNEQLNFIIDDPKAFLLKAQKTKALITAKRERINEWRDRAKSIVAQLDSEGSTGKGYKQSIIENTICSISVLENEIIEECGILADTERVIREVIDSFVTDERYRAVLELRYLNGYSWRIIGNRLNYGEDWVCRLHGFALQEIIKFAESARIKSVQPAV